MSFILFRINEGVLIILLLSSFDPKDSAAKTNLEIFDLSDVTSYIYYSYCKKGRLLPFSF